MEETALLTFLENTFACPVETWRSWKKIIACRYFEYCKHDEFADFAEEIDSLEIKA